MSLDAASAVLGYFLLFVLFLFAAVSFVMGTRRG